MSNNREKKGWKDISLEDIGNVAFLKVEENHDKGRITKEQSEELTIFHKRILNIIANELNELFIKKESDNSALKRKMLPELKALKKENNIGDINLYNVIKRIIKKGNDFNNIDKKFKLAEKILQILKESRGTVREVINSEMEVKEKIDFLNSLVKCLKNMNIGYFLSYKFNNERMITGKDQIEDFRKVNNKFIEVANEFCELISYTKIKDNDKYTLGTNFILKTAIAAIDLQLKINREITQNSYNAFSAAGAYVAEYKKSKHKVEYKNYYKRIFLTLNRYKREYINIYNENKEFRRTVLNYLCNTLEDFKKNKEKYILDIDDLNKIDNLYLIEDKYGMNEARQNKKVQEEVFIFNYFVEIIKEYLKAKSAMENNLFSFDEDLGQRLLSVVDGFEVSNFYNMKKISDKEFDEYYMYSQSSVLKYYMIKEYLQDNKEKDNTMIVELENISIKFQNKLKELEKGNDLKEKNILISYIDEKEINNRKNIDLSFIKEDSFGLRLKLPKRFESVGVQLLGDLIDNLIDNLISNMRQTGGLVRLRRNRNVQGINEENIHEKIFDIFKNQIREYDLNREMKENKENLINSGQEVGKIKAVKKKI